MLNKSLSIIGAVSISLALSACGSSDSFAKMEDRGTALAAKYAETPPTETMPTEGTATYKGYAGYSADENAETADYASNVTLNANFADATIDGSLTNFRDANNGKLAGSVAVTDGAIDENGFIADLSGTLSQGGESGEVTGAMGGTFYGEGAEAVFGGMTGEITTADGSVPLYGIFIAEKK